MAPTLFDCFLIEQSDSDMIFGDAAEALDFRPVRLEFLEEMRTACHK